MADKKISELTALTGADTATDDQLVIVDTSAGLTKSITVAEFQNALDGSTGFVRITGDTMTGNLNMGDNVKAIFGAGPELQIYSDGTSGIIKDVGAGDIKILADDFYVQNAAGNSTLISVLDTGKVGLGFAGSEKLATTSTGVDITGTVTSDGLTTSGVVKAPDGSAAAPAYTNSGDTDGGMYFPAANQVAFATGGSEAMRIDSSGNVGIGTSSPLAKLQIKTQTNGNAAFQNSTSVTGGVKINAFNDAGNASAPFEIDGSSLQFNIASVEKMRIDSSGNVGIGLTAPTGILSISGADTTSKPQLRFMSGEGTGLADAALSTTDDSGGTSLLIGSNLYYSGGSITRFSTSRSGAAIDFGYTGSMKFYTGSGNTAPDQKMTLDANGNVGIGTPSPSVETPLTAYYSATSQMHLGGPASIVSNNVYFNGSAWVNRNSSVGGAMVQMTTDGETHFRRAGTGASPTVSYSATIDASGNLLVGKTSTDYLTNGVEAKPDGSLWTTATNNGPLVATRKSSDGNIASFYKDSSFVGSIGVSGNDFYVTGSATNIAGTYFANSKIMPMKSGATSDNTIDLGTSSKRFKDLYLSGGVVFGDAGGSGTSTSNTLDSYEEGTWTATLPNGGTLTNNSSTYIKIGNKVTVTTYVANIDPTADASQFRLGGLPFTNVNTSNYYVGGSFGYVGQNNLSDLLPITGVNLDYIYFQENDGTAASISNNTMRTKGLTGDSADAMILTITYFT